MRRPIQRAVRVLACCAALLGAVGSPSRAAPDTVERIEIQGLFRMTESAFLHALGISPGDPYDEDQIRDRFRSLWEMGLFSDIVIEAEDGPEGGKVLVVKVTERPVLSSVTYADNKVLSRTAIEDGLREREVDLGIGRPLDLDKIGAAEQVIRELLMQKGFLDSVVRHRIEDVTETSRSVTFTIVPGSKTRIKKIDFTGNELFKDRALKKALELTKEQRWYWPWSKKALYHPLKWDQDVGEVRQLYLDRGYLDVEIRVPVVELRPKSPKKQEKRKKEIEPPQKLIKARDHFRARAEREGLSPGKQKNLQKRVRILEDKIDKRLKKARLKAESAGRQWAYLTVPVVEGKQYTTGEITVTGNEVFTDEEILGQLRILLREGSILRDSALDYGVDLITRRYEDRGHLYASVVRRIDRRPEEAIADVQIVITEDRPYRIDRIEFSGNTTTQDRVLRREVVLTEGQLFNRTLLDLSRRKLGQLGYVQVPDEPVIEPTGEEGQDEVRIRFGVEEQGRNEIQVGGGYSGLDGAFFSGVYSTRNFLGRGQVVSTAVQLGGRSDRYTLSFTEPWFLNRPITFGASIFRQDVDYGGTLRSSSKGGGLLLGKRVGNFAGVNVGYRWEKVSSTSFFADPSGTSLVTATAENTISSLTPSFSINTVNNPYRPSRGRNFVATMQIAGGPLGGDTSFLKPQLGFTVYRRATKRSFFALNTRVGYVTQWQGGSPENSANVNGVPRFQRYWLGGDQLGPRVFETRTITPLRYVILNDAGGIAEVLGDPRGVPLEDLLSNAFGQPALLEVGGNRFYLGQFEWVFPLNEQVEIAGFVDVGDALFDDQSLDFATMRASAGVELRFHLPVFPVPIRLIYGNTLRELEGDRSSSFQFSIGRSF